MDLDKLENIDWTYLYRGTTAGWPGNSVLQAERITCTSTDPVVATLFAVQCRNHGRAIIVAAKRANFQRLLGPANHFSVLESAVNLYVPPLEFVAKAEIILDVDRALAILREMGFEDLPVRIRDQESLRDALLQTYEAGHRLNEEQRLWFDSRMREGTS
jgi:hypothetical protein